MSEKKEDKNNFISRLFGFSIGPIVNAFIGFISVPITTYFLFPEELGKASMYMTTIGILSSVVFLGLIHSHLREYESSKNKAQLLYNCLLPPIIISLFILIVSFIFRKEISNLLYGEYSSLGMVLFAITMPATVLERFAANIVRMEDKAKLYSLNQILQKVLSFLLLLLFFLYISPTYHAVLISSLGSIMFSTIIQIWWMKGIWKGIFNSTFDKDMLKQLLKFGLPLVPSAALLWVFNSIDKVALRNFADFQEIGYYSGAFKIVALLNIVKKSFINFWTPTSYKWFDSNEKIEKYQKVSDYLMGIFVIMAAIAIFSKEIIFKLLSEKYQPSSYIFPFLMFIPIMSTVTATTMVGIQFMRKTKYNMYSAFFVAILNVIGNIILVPKYGAIGASISTGISYIAYFYIRSYYSNRIWKKINLVKHSINIILLTLMATFSIMQDRIIFLELIIILAIVAFNINIIKDVVKLIKNKFKI